MLHPYTELLSRMQATHMLYLLLARIEDAGAYASIYHAFKHLCESLEGCNETNKYWIGQHLSSMTLDQLKGKIT